jgi:hypothetical protein
MHLRTLLAECAKKLNQYGPDSPQVEEFIQKHKANEEFVQLAELARTLKREVWQRRGTPNPALPSSSVVRPSAPVVSRQATARPGDTTREA